MKILAIVIAALGCQLCLGQSLTISGRIVDEQHRPVPFANVVLLHGSDTLSMVQGTASDLSGRYAFEGVAPGAYLLKASFVGYKTASARLQAARSRSCDLLLQRDSMSIGEVVVEGERSIRSIDKSSYLFSEAQIAQASDGRELVATLPNLRIDRTSDALATVNGKRLLLLINGIKASDEDLRLIPADKIRKVELYDVPPIRYMNDAERVVNILTKPLDAGWSGNLYGTLGQMFSNASVTLSHVRGDNRFTFHYGAHINMKREVRNRETGRYAYRIGEENYLYDYLRESLKWGHQHNFGLTYTRSREQSYDLQIKASAHTDNEWMEADKRISFARNTLQEERTGRLTDRTESLVPTLDLYFAKYFSERSTLDVNLVGSYFDNRQRTRSTESGTTGFDDLMLLDNRKSSLIGEAAYLHRFSRAQLTVGYRSQCNFLSNRLRNSVSGQPQSERINTQKHYLYAEISGKFHSWLYRASLGATADIRSGEGGFRHLTFTPVVMLGYAIDRANTLRLAYDSDTRMPEMQQMSEARILLMSDFYQTGNAELKNAHRQSWRLSYDLQLRRFSLQAALSTNRRATACSTPTVRATAACCSRPTTPSGTSAAASSSIWTGRPGSSCASAAAQRPHSSFSSRRRHPRPIAAGAFPSRSTSRPITGTSRSTYTRSSGAPIFRGSTRAASRRPPTSVWDIRTAPCALRFSASSPSCRTDTRTAPFPKAWYATTRTTT